MNGPPVGSLAERVVRSELRLVGNDLDSIAVVVRPLPRPSLVLVPTDPDTPTSFNDLAEQWLSTRRDLKSSTRVSYQIKITNQLGPSIGHIEATELGVDDLTALTLRMEETNYAPRTIRDALTIAKTILDFGQRRGLLSANPARLLSARERPRITRYRARVLAPNEIAALLGAAHEPYRTIIAVAVFAGLRSGEVAGLQWGDVDLANQRLHVRRQAHLGKLVPPKTTNSVRTVALLGPLAAILGSYRDSLPSADPADLLFTDKGRPLRTPRLCYTLRRIADRAGIVQHPDEPPLRFHDCRHTAASIMIAGRADIAFVARQLGHASPATTLGIYAHLFDEASNLGRVGEYVNGQFAGLAAAA